MKKNMLRTITRPEDYIGTVTFANLRSILRNAKRENISYQLAGQLASTELALEAGYLKEQKTIFAPSLRQFGASMHGPLSGHIHFGGTIQLGVLVDAVITELRAHPYATELDSWWMYQNVLNSVLKRVNSEAVTRAPHL